MPLREVRCTTCQSVEERIELRDGDALVDPCTGCGEEGTLEVLLSRFAIKMDGHVSTAVKSDWDRYDSATLQTEAGAFEAGYEVAREAGIAPGKARESARKAADGMRRAGARVLEAQAKQAEASST